LVDIGEVQNAYNLKLRDDEDVLRFCADHDFAYVPFLPDRVPAGAVASTVMPWSSRAMTPRVIRRREPHHVSLRDVG
jgi:hypothetical protein